MIQKRFTVWIECDNGDKNPVGIGLREKEISNCVKEWNDGRRIFIEDVVKSNQNMRTGKKNDEWGYIEIVKIIN